MSLPTHSITLEINADTLYKLLENHELGIESFRCTNKQGQEFVRDSVLSLAKLGLLKQLNPSQSD